MFIITVRKRKTCGGVPAVAQWVKNLTAAAQVSAEAQVQSLAWHSGLKDPKKQNKTKKIQHCHELWYRLQMWLESRIAVALA